MKLPADILPVASVDGAFVAADRAVVSAFDRGFLVADGIFETFHVTDGVPLSWDLHMDRLEASAAFLRLRPPCDRERLARLVAGLIERNGLDRSGAGEAALRLTVTRGTRIDGPPTVTIYARRLTPGHLAKRADGVLTFVLPFTRHDSGGLARHKTLSYLASSLGQVVLRDRTTDPRAEGLFVSPSGDVLEGASSNVFAVEGDRVVTPPIEDGLLPGTSRLRVLRSAPGCGFEVREEPIPVERLRAAEEAFITSSTLHVAPIVALEGAPIGGGRRGPKVTCLQQAFAEDVRREVAAWSVEPL